MISRRIIIYIIVLISAVWLCYFNSLPGQFLWDDESLIVENEMIRDISNIPHFFKFNSWPTEYKHFYRPVQLVTYAIDYLFWKLNSFGYHFGNVFFHMLNVLLGFILFLLLGVSGFSAFLGMLVFAVNPLHTEAIAYVSGRADLLVLFFLLLAANIFVYLQRCSVGKTELSSGFFLEQGSKRLFYYFLWSVIAYAGALCSKEIAYMFPLLLFVWFVIFKRYCEIQWQLFCVVVISAILAGALFYARYQYQSNAEFNIFAFSGLERFSVGVKAFALYFLTFFYPVGLHMERLVLPAEVFYEKNFLLSFFFAMSFTAFSVWAFFKSKKNALACVWILIFLLPVLNIVPLNATFAEHWFYVSAIGLCLLIANIHDTFKFRKELTVVLLAFCLVCTDFTFFRNKDWTDPVRFYLATLKYRPNDVKVHYNLANEYFKRDEYGAAKEHYSAVINISEKAELKSNGQGSDILKSSLLAKAYNNLGTVYVKQKKYKKAEFCYKTALILDPAKVSSQKNLENLKNLL